MGVVGMDGYDGMDGALNMDSCESDDVIEDLRKAVAKLQQQGRPTGSYAETHADIDYLTEKEINDLVEKKAGELIDKRQEDLKPKFTSIEQKRIQVHDFDKEDT